MHLALCLVFINLALMSHTWSTVFSFGFVTTRKTLRSWNMSRKEQWKWWRNWSTNFTESIWRNWECQVWRREGSGETLSLSTMAWKEGGLGRILGKKLSQEEWWGTGTGCLGSEITEITVPEVFKKCVHVTLMDVANGNVGVGLMIELNGLFQPWWFCNYVNQLSNYYITKRYWNFLHITGKSSSKIPD